MFLICTQLFFAEAIEQGREQPANNKKKQIRKKHCLNHLNSRLHQRSIKVDTVKIIKPSAFALNNLNARNMLAEYVH